MTRSLQLPPGFGGQPLRTPTLPPASHTNCYIVGTGGALVVDPGSGHRRELELLWPRLYRLRGEGGTVAGVLLTHHHPDHVGGAETVAAELGAPLLAHTATFERLPRGSAPRHALADGERLQVDGHRGIDVLHTPGHAVGHLCLWEAERAVLLAGDMIAGIGTTLIDPAEGDMAQYLRSLERLAALEPGWILPAHGPTSCAGERVIQELIDHRRERERRVLASCDAEPRPLLEIARRAYAELPPWSIGLAVRSTLAHLLKLADDGAVLREGERWRRPQRTSSTRNLR